MSNQASSGYSSRSASNTGSAENNSHDISSKECDAGAILRDSNESQSSGASSEYIFVSGNVQENKETNDPQLRGSDNSQGSGSSEGFEVFIGGNAFQIHKTGIKPRISNNSSESRISGPDLLPATSKDDDIVNEAELRDSQESKSSEGSAHAKVSGHQKATRHSTVLGDSQSSEESNNSLYAQVGNHQHIVDEEHPELSLGMKRQVGPSVVLDVNKLQNGHSTRKYRQRYRHSPLNNIPMASSREVDRGSTIQFDLNSSMRDNIRRGLNRQQAIPFDTIEEETEDVSFPKQNKEKGLSMKKKCMILLIVMVISTAGIAVLIHYLKETYPDAFLGNIIDPDVKKPSTLQQTVLLGDQRTLIVHVDRTLVEDIGFLNISTPIMDNEGKDIIVPYSLGKIRKRKSDDWNPSYNPITQIMTVKGPTSKCSSNGAYTVTLLNDNSDIIGVFSAELAVKNDVGQTTLTQDQYEDLDLIQFTCVYRHGCQKSELEFVVDIDNKEIVYNGINSSSAVTFNETEGFVETYKINMTESLEQRANHVTCQSKTKTNCTGDTNSIKSSVSILPLNAIACDIDNGCEFKCNDLYGNNYYAVDQLRCDKFYRCYNNNIFSYTCRSGTFFDSSPKVCTCGFKKDLPWCNDNGSLKEGVDVSKEVCGNT